MAQEKKTSLFDMAAKKKPATSKSPEKAVVNVAGISVKLKRHAELKSLIKIHEAEMEMLSGELKAILKERYMEIYTTQKRKPESFKVTSDNGGEVLLIVQDKYIKVDEGKAAQLESFPDVLDTKKTYTFNAEVLEKEGVGEKISEAIMNCDICDEDKAKLLVVEELQFIKKGTIDRLMQYDDPKTLFQLIEPIVMLK